jgi:microcystin-dependent protein
LTYSLLITQNKNSSIMNTPFLGMITYYAFDFVPGDWMPCHGQLLSVNQYQQLFSLLGTTYGGNGQTTFALPDLRGRTAVGMGGTYSIGIKEGTETTTLTEATMPQHTHTATLTLGAVKDRSESADPTDAAPSHSDNGPLYAAKYDAIDLGLPQVAVLNSGGSASFNTMNPVLPLNCCIAIRGVFPPRS